MLPVKLIAQKDPVFPSAVHRIVSIRALLDRHSASRGSSAACAVGDKRIFIGVISIENASSECHVRFEMAFVDDKAAIS